MRLTGIHYQNAGMQCPFNTSQLILVIVYIRQICSLHSIIGAFQTTPPSLKFSKCIFSTIFTSAS